jgi:ATP sulfurylase
MQSLWSTGLALLYEIRNVSGQVHIYKICRNFDMKKAFSKAQKVIVKETWKTIINFQTIDLIFFINFFSLVHCPVLNIRIILLQFAEL